MKRDPRYFQILALCAMLFVGTLWRDFPISPGAALIVIGGALLTQMAAIYWFELAWKNLLSAMISALSVLLLCRADSVWVLGVAAVFAIASKFIFRFRKKHFFNPTNFGIVVLLWTTGRVWISPGQWGDDMSLAFWIVLMGAVVVFRAQRFDVSLAFLGVFALLLFARVTYLGQNALVLPHQLADGSLIIFTFFMVSDPRSTPDHPMARLVFGALVGVMAFWLRFHWFRPTAPLEALFVLSPFTMVLDIVWKRARFEWSSPPIRRLNETRLVAQS